MAAIFMRNLILSHKNLINVALSLHEFVLQESCSSVDRYSERRLRDGILLAVSQIFFSLNNALLYSRLFHVIHRT